MRTNTWPLLYICHVPFNPQKTISFISVSKDDFSLMKQTAAVCDDFHSYDTHQKSPSLIHIWAMEAASPMSCHCIWSWSFGICCRDFLDPGGLGPSVGSHTDPARCLVSVRAAERLPPPRHIQQDPITPLPLPACLPAWEARLRQWRKHYRKYIAADKVNGFNCRDSQPNKFERVHTAGRWREEIERKGMKLSFVW